MEIRQHILPIFILTIGFVIATNGKVYRTGFMTKGCRMKYIKSEEFYLKGARTMYYRRSKALTYKDCEKVCCFQKQFECKSFTYFELSAACYIMNITAKEYGAVRKRHRSWVHGEVKFRAVLTSTPTSTSILTQNSTLTRISTPTSTPITTHTSTSTTTMTPVSAQTTSVTLECIQTTTEVLFVLDGSKSIRRGFELMKNWIKRVVGNLTNNAMSFGVVQYSKYLPSLGLTDQPYIVTEVKIGQYERLEDFLVAIDNITFQGLKTHTGAALKKIALDFASTKNYGKINNSQIMILMTQGRSDDGDVIAEASDFLRNMSVITYAVGIKPVFKEELQLIATGNTADNTRVIILNRFKHLDAFSEQMQMEIRKYGSAGSDCQSAEGMKSSSP